MRISVNGDCATITSTINFDDLKKVGPVVLVDENNAQQYAAMVVNAPNGGIGKAVANFDFKNTEGFACVNLRCSADTATAKEQLLAQEFENLNKYEQEINDEIAAKLEAREALAANITFN